MNDIYFTYSEEICEVCEKVHKRKIKERTIQCDRCASIVCNRDNECCMIFPHYNNTTVGVCSNCVEEIWSKFRLVTGEFTVKEKVDLSLVKPVIQESPAPYLTCLKSKIKSGNLSPRPRPRFSPVLLPVPEHLSEAMSVLKENIMHLPSHGLTAPLIC